MYPLINQGLKVAQYPQAARASRASGIRSERSGPGVPQGNSRGAMNTNGLEPSSVSDFNGTAW